ncbi:MAG TPA: D-aminoacyl-tRNA deacylase [Syntrophobacteraceae bacterium]|nr:D-aminoacyl-tRNA deacylase [Syntrophobacteraceae bacterium]
MPPFHQKTRVKARTVRPILTLGFLRRTYYIEKAFYILFSSVVKRQGLGHEIDSAFMEGSVRAVVQRVLEASVRISGEVVGRIGRGILVFIGIGCEDASEDVLTLAEKVLHLRIFPDAFDKMNLSVLDIAGEILVISQFTLLGDCRKGRRPSYISAAPPEHAEPLYQAFVDAVRQSGRRVETGRFQETMQVHLINDGPVTLLLDSRKVF